ncbi:TPA: hypothetical protein KOS25_003969 [Clostridioides difficile]|uniref:hypothetical protein n=1 Tax=Clostridioides difficile TaxID=1496 RepID=UPI001C19696D|nr:hypothetical protein [Clostridioides difficile]HBF7390049.1 hypothetical protein [Clostridioides difficile]
MRSKEKETITNSNSSKKVIELKHEQTTLRIPKDLYKALIDLSREIGMPIASIVIIACWLYISKIN